MVSLVNDWQSKIQRSSQEGNTVEIREVHIQEVDDTSDINPLNRTNNQENSRMMKLSALKAVVPKNQYSQTMILPSPAVINTSEQKS